MTRKTEDSRLPPVNAPEVVAFDVSTIAVHGAATRVGDVIHTPEQCWAYSLVVPLGDAMRSSGDPLAVITADVDIIEGRLGFGAVNVRGDAFLVEHHVDSGRRHMTLRVPVEEIGAIVFRNASGSGPSRFRVHRLTVARQQDAMLYPVHLAARDVRNEPVPSGGGTIVFNDDPAAVINRARMEFVLSLNLPLSGSRILDVGAGVGHFANLYASLGANVVAVEGRRENLEEMRHRYPAIVGHFGDAQHMDLRALGTFEIVHCFGLLYHLDSPVAALRRMEEVCGAVLLLETMVVDAVQPVMVLADETFAVNQAIAGLGCRPSPSFVTLALNRVGFPFVYAAASPPQHPDFRFEWRDNMDTSRDGHNLRCIFVASRTRLENPALIPLLAPDTVTYMPGPNAIAHRTRQGRDQEQFSHLPTDWSQPFERLRQKWGTVPGGNHDRKDSTALLALSDRELLARWEESRQHDTLGHGFGIRGWYHEAYRTFIRGKKVLDIGCGMGLSTISFAEMGADVTFVDIVENNTRLVERICRLKGLTARVLYMSELTDLDGLDIDFDVVTAIGSLINAPLAFTKDEIAAIKRHLRVGGRWLHFAYPKSRWEREGSPPYAKWGEMTDGPGTPWMEYHDVEKVRWLFEPSQIRVIFDCEWHNSDFNWFDIELIEH